MYELIKKQIAADYFQQRFPNDGQRFVAWYLRNILFRDMNETRDDITDGRDDKQIDAIVIDDEKSLWQIIQGKFIQGTLDAESLRAASNRFSTRCVEPGSARRRRDGSSSG